MFKVKCSSWYTTNQINSSWFQVVSNHFNLKWEKRMKCKNQYGWQEVLTCKQRWMTGSSNSRNPRWLNFLWSYFRQVELSAKFKVKCLTTVESISSYTFALSIAQNQSFFFFFFQTNVKLVMLSWAGLPCDLTMWLDHVLLGAGGWSAQGAHLTMCFLLWAEHEVSLLGIEETHCHTHFAYLSLIVLF